MRSKGRLSAAKLWRIVYDWMYILYQLSYFIPFIKFNSRKKHTHIVSLSLSLTNGLFFTLILGVSKILWWFMNWNEHFTYTHQWNVFALIHFAFSSIFIVRKVVRIRSLLITFFSLPVRTSGYMHRCHENMRCHLKC